MNAEHNFRGYYLTDKYKGFYKCQGPHNGFSRMRYLTFTNGETTIQASGVYLEEAMAKMFMAIDKYYSTEKNANSMPHSKMKFENTVFSLN